MTRESTKVAVMQEQIKNLDVTVTQIMTNHLPHIQAGVDEVKEEVVNLRIAVAKYIGIGVGVLGLIELGLKWIK
jgi:hypothetical protein